MPGSADATDRWRDSRIAPGGAPRGAARLPGPARSQAGEAGGLSGGLAGAHLDRIGTFKEMQNDPDFSICPQPVGFFWRVVDGKTEIRPAPCKRYDCPHCGKIKKNQVLDKIYWGTVDIQMNTSALRSWRIIRSLTLTQHIEDPTDIMEAYNRFRTSLRDKGYRNIRYFWVKEFTRKNKRHLHILINRYIPQGVIAAAWKQATLGWSYIVHITRVNMTIRKPAGYFAKYVGKALHDQNFRKHEHRYGHDQDTDWTCYSALPPGENKWKFEYLPSPVKNLKSPEDLGGRPGPDLAAGPGPPG